MSDCLLRISEVVAVNVKDFQGKRLQSEPQKLTRKEPAKHFISAKIPVRY